MDSHVQTLTGVEQMSYSRGNLGYLTICQLTPACPQELGLNLDASLPWLFV